MKEYAPTLTQYIIQADNYRLVVMQALLVVVCLSDALETALVAGLLFV